MSSTLKKFRRDFSIISWIGFGSFLALSLLSYNPQDPSFSSTGTGRSVVNLCGYVGSFLSDIFYQGFGVASWFFVGFIFYWGIKNLLRQDKPATSNIVWAFLLMIAVTGLIHLFIPDTRIFQGHVLLSGSIGLGLAKTLMGVLNKAGAAVILLSFTFMGFVALLEVTIDQFIESLTKKLSSPFHAGLGKLGAGVMALSQSWWDSLFELGKKKKVLAAAKAVPTEMEVSAKSASHRFLIQKNEIEPVDFEEPGIHVSEEDEEEEGVTEAAAPRKASRETRSVLDVEIAPMQTAKRAAVKIQRHIENWMLPKLSLLVDPPVSRVKVDEKEIRNTSHMLEDKLAQFSVNGSVVAVKPGPAVTMFEFKPNADVKISKITELADDLALALSSESIRIIAPVPGRDVVGIETSNAQREKVFLKDILSDGHFWDDKVKLPIVLGKQANGASRVVDLRKMPHLLVAGTTGSGKSVFVVSVLTGLLFRHSPKTLRLILVDPKQVDLAAFQNLPHLLLPPVRDPRKAVSALKWAISEMEKRYRSMSKFGARGLEEFNQVTSNLSRTQVEEFEKENTDLEGASKQRSYYFTPQPYIVIVVEEFGDLMSVDKVNVEHNVVRLAQMARACGIHLILAMQSPRRDVITGLIKTNIPGRISFKVASKMDSRIILDESGAERLLANGDMLFLAPGVAKPERHHGAWLSEEEINQVAAFWSDQSEPNFDDNAVRAVESFGDESGGDMMDGELNPDAEERYDEILDYVSSQREVSASLLQRKFRLGYPRAARMIEIFEKEGVVGPANGSKPRQVLINKAP
ncbi:MAG: DNA translocase FtsK [Bdellovibrionales bacterium]